MALSLTVRLPTDKLYNFSRHNSLSDISDEAGFEEEDAEQLHHTLVDSEGNLSTLAIRKGGSGTWTLAPGE